MASSGKETSAKPNIDSSTLFTGSPTSSTSTARPSGGLPEGNVANTTRTSGGITRELPARETPPGKGPLPVDARKYRYDIYRARTTKAVAYGATKDSVMSTEEAGARLHDLHVRYGVDREDDALLMAFDKALWFCHTINSGSTLQPGRSVITIGEGASQLRIDFSHVVAMLGVDLRRFFRAFADDIAAVNQEKLAAYDPYNPQSVEEHGWITQVAHERGMHRYPHLCHDSADACHGITPAERAALASSKVGVLSATVNAADRMFNNTGVQSADGFDSTNRRSVTADLKTAR